MVDRLLQKQGQGCVLVESFPAFEKEPQRGEMELRAATADELSAPYWSASAEKAELSGSWESPWETQSGEGKRHKNQTDFSHGRKAYYKTPIHVVAFGVPDANLPCS